MSLLIPEMALRLSTTWHEFCLPAETVMHWVSLLQYQKLYTRDHSSQRANACSSLLRLYWVGSLTLPSTSTYVLATHWAVSTRRRVVVIHLHPSWG